MSTNEDLVVFGLICFLLFFLMFVQLLASRTDWRTGFLIRRKFKKMNWLKIFKWWAYMQVFMIITQLPNLMEKWTLVLFFPLTLILFLVVYAFSNRLEVDNKYLNSDEAEIYKKAFDREKKINKII